MKAVSLVSFVTLSDLMRGVVSLVTLVTLVNLKVGNRIWGVYKSVTLVTPVTLIYKAILSKTLSHYYTFCGLGNCPDILPYIQAKTLKNLNYGWEFNHIVLTLICPPPPFIMYSHYVFFEVGKKSSKWKDF